jgi:hypothetical protein
LGRRKPAGRPVRQSEPPCEALTDRGVEPMNDEGAEVTGATQEAEAEEAKAPHRADRAPTPEEEESIEGDEVDPDVRTHYREMTELGVHEVGEGRIP